MSAKLAKTRANPKSGRFPTGNRNSRDGNQISPVMQKARGLLGPVKAAQELTFLTAQPLSLCQKNLSGARDENRDMLAAMAKTKLVIAVVLGLTEGATDPIAREMNKAARKIELKMKLAAIDSE